MPIMADGADRFGPVPRLVYEGHPPQIMAIPVCGRLGEASEKSANPLARKRNRDQRTSSLPHLTAPDGIQ